MYYSLDNVDYPVLKIPDELLGNKQKMLNYGIILSISSEKYIFLVDYIGEIEELVPRKINIDNLIIGKNHSFNIRPFKRANIKKVVLIQVE